MNKPLANKIIRLVRTADGAEPLLAAITALGGEAELLSLLHLVPLTQARDIDVLQAALKHLERYAVVVFVSPNAVRFAMEAALMTWPQNVKAAAIGPATAAALQQWGISPSISTTDAADSEHLLQHPALCMEAVAGKKILILRGDSGRELLAEVLRARGAEVDRVACYMRVAMTEEALLSSCSGKIPDATIVFSSESLRRLQGLSAKLKTHCKLDAWMRRVLFTGHRRIAESARELGWSQVECCAKGYDVLLDQVRTYLAQHIGKAVL